MALQSTGKAEKEQKVWGRRRWNKGGWEGGTEVGWQMMQILEDSRHVQMAGDRFLVPGSKEHGSSV